MDRRGGLRQGPADARSELRAALSHPARSLAAKIEARERWGALTRLSLPGDRRLKQAVDWGKQNVADSTQYAEDLEIRWVDQGKRYPPPAGELASARWVGAGFPDYPWLFATDGEYTAFAMVALGQFEAIADHMRALQEASDIVNDAFGQGGPRMGVRRLDVVRRRTPTRATPTRRSSSPAPWRSSGAGPATTASSTGCTTSRSATCATSCVSSTRTATGGRRASATSSVPAWAPEKLDNTVYFIRGLYDLADLARSKHDGRTYAWARNLARELHRRFEDAWWMEDQSLHADSLSERTRRSSRSTGSPSRRWRRS